MIMALYESALVGENKEQRKEQVMDAGMRLRSIF